MLRSLAARTVGNPGPSTLQFRQQTARLAAASARNHAREQSTETAELSRDVIKARRRAARGVTFTTPATDKSRISPSSTAAGSTPTSKDQLLDGRAPDPQMASVRLAGGHQAQADVPIPLAIPRDYELIERHVNAMSWNLYDGKLEDAMREWHTLMEMNAIECVSSDDYAAMVANLVASIEGEKEGQVAGLFYYQPTLFDACRHFVIEAAARQHWRGLHQCMIELLRYQLPLVARTTYEEYVRRARVVAGINVDDLYSPVRAKRIAARLDGPGMMPLVIAQVAAFAMLKQFDQRDIMDLFSTTANLFSRSRLQTAMWDTQGAVFRGNDNGKEHMERFRSYCDKLVVALYCYHPPALVLHIVGISQTERAGNIGILAKLYKAVMDGSTGPDRFIIPTTNPSEVRFVPLTFLVWLAFMNAFARVQRPDMIMRIIDVEFPARYGETTLELLGPAMQALLVAANKAPAHTRTYIFKCIEDIWKRVQAMGGETDPYLVRLRLTVLRINNETKMGSFEETCAKLFASLQVAKVSDATQAVVPPLFTHLCARNRYAAALDLIKGMGEFGGISLAAKFGSKDLVTTACFQPNFTYGQRRVLLTEILRRLSPELQRLGPNTGSILSFLLEGGKPIAKTVASVVPKGFPAYYYFGLLRRLFVVHRGVPVPIYNLEAAVNILETVVPTDTSTAGTRYVMLWSLVITAVARSSLAPAALRLDLLDRAYASFPITTQSTSIHLANLLRQSATASLERDDDEGGPEASRAWTASVSASDASIHAGTGTVADRFQCASLVLGFVRRDMPDLAIQVVRAGVRRKAIANFMHTFLGERGEWTTPEFDEQLHASGFIDEHGAVVDQLPRGVLPKYTGSWGTDTYSNRGEDDRLDGDEDDHLDGSEDEVLDDAEDADADDADVLDATEGLEGPM